MNYKNIKKVTILGIGGKGAYYIAKFLHLAGAEVIGYDLKESDNTKNLEKLGIKINYRNPQRGEKLKGDFYLYSNDIPLKIQNEIKKDNKGTKSYEIGAFYHMVIDDYENQEMDENIKNIFLKSDIAPLFKIDCNKMKYIGITGTDGKTTTCTMIYHVLKDNGLKPALITTVSAKIGDEDMDTGFHTTTPSSQELYRLIKRVEEQNCTHLIIESTSHGLQQGRLAGLKFDIVGYTNITNEHLDYHKTWKKYVDAKSLLIRKHLKPDGRIFLNRDDKAFKILKKYSNKYIDYGVKRKADIYAKDIDTNPNNINFVLENNKQDYNVILPLLGIYNVSNFLLAFGITKELGINIESIIKSITNFKTVEGRMQVIQEKPFKVIVDYAHTPNAIKEVLISSRELTNGRIIHVFGSAGQRDQYKRPEMGKWSNELADITILTAEDCRLEDLKEINNEIESGWRKGRNRNSEIYRFDYMDKNVEVRRDAIKKALELANEGDLVIITGKAHERSLCFGQTEYPWNDITEVKKLLNINS